MGGHDLPNHRQPQSDAWLIGSHAAYANVLEARGDIEGALDQLKRAVAVTRPDLAPPTAATSGEVEETA